MQDTRWRPYVGSIWWKADGAFADREHNRFRVIGHEDGAVIYERVGDGLQRRLELEFWADEMRQI